ncbi:hypothetical protein EJ07DRAFT_154265 [Lizonia empirigonia]|nr:hypothetical protein EJ07DRAFT_154265 [Lizonia empirigonia]
MTSPNDLPPTAIPHPPAERSLFNKDDDYVGYEHSGLMEESEDLMVKSREMIDQAKMCSAVWWEDMDAKEDEGIKQSELYTSLSNRACDTQQFCIRFRQMSVAPETVPTPEAIEAEYAANLAKLEGKLARLKAKIVKHEQDLELLKEKSLTQKKPSNELEKNMTIKKGLVQNARREYERAVAAHYNASKATYDEVVRRIKAAEETMAEIKFEME